jgi:preprotein translocase subunit SecY
MMRRSQPPAAQAQHRRRHPADLRQLAAAAAADHHPVRRQVGLARHHLGQVIIALNQYLGHGKPLYMLLYALGIVFFCFFTAVVFNPEETADNLKRNGGFIPGIRPGKNTATYLDYVLTRSRFWALPILL